MTHETLTFYPAVKDQQGNLVIQGLPAEESPDEYVICLASAELLALSGSEYVAVRYSPEVIDEQESCWDADAECK